MTSTVSAPGTRSMSTGKPPRFTWTDFLAVRPSFTLAALRLLWFAILAREVLAYAALVERMLRGPAGEALFRYTLIDGAIVALGRLFLPRLILAIPAQILPPEGMRVHSRSNDPRPF